MRNGKTIVRAIAAIAAIAASTTVVSAATSHPVKMHSTPTPPPSYASGPPASLMCKKGMTPTLHTMGKMYWSCTKVA